MAQGGDVRKVWWLAVGTVGGVFLAALLPVAPAIGQPFVNWAQYLYSDSHSSDNQAATTVTPSNAAQLKSVWRFVPSAAPISGLGGFYSSPTVYNGVIYIGARNGYFYAINETTGAVIWKRFVGYVTHKTCGAEGFTSTATVAADPTTGDPTIYVYGATGYLYAMNTADGTDVWPPTVVAIPSTTKNDYYAWDSPLVFDGNIYVGISSQCDDPLVRGGLDEFSQATGTLENTFWTTPAGTRGASIWSSPATDGSAIYVTTGNGPTSSAGFSVIELNPALSQQLGIWAVPPAQRISDSDFGGSPGLWTATIDGTPTPMVGACNKNGYFYALQTADLSAGPVWSLKIADPYRSGPGECDAAPVYDGTNLYLGSSGTTINGTAYDGSVRAVKPATGAIIWQTGLTGSVVGTPTMDGAGVIAAATFGSSTGHNGVFLIDAATGKILKTLAYAKSDTFAQPVFADGYLIVASTGRALQAYAVG
jgi:outer membrane protein assembly factor BamB